MSSSIHATARQAVAQALATYIHERGGMVLSPLPLRHDSSLRVEFRSEDRQPLIDLERMGFAPIFVTRDQQMKPGPNAGPCDVSVFEIQLD